MFNQQGLSLLEVLISLALASLAVLIVFKQQYHLSRYVQRMEMRWQTALQYHD